MAKNRRRNRRRLIQPLLRAGKRFKPLRYTLSGKPMVFGFMQGITPIEIDPGRNVYIVNEPIVLELSHFGDHTMSTMDDETLRRLMERYGITVDNLLASSDWEPIYGSNEFGTRTIIGITNASPIVIEPLPQHDDLDAVLADNERRLRDVRAIGGDEEKAMCLNCKMLNQLLSRPDIRANDEMTELVFTAFRQSCDDLKAFRSRQKTRIIPCPCGHRQPLDATSDDYGMGLAFCDNCGAGYSLEFHGDRYAGYRAFADS